MTTSSPATFRPVSLIAAKTASESNVAAEDASLRSAAKPAFPEDEHWIPVFVTPCVFAPTHFNHVMDNLLRNPNLTSSCLFRADILYDSEKDALADLSDCSRELQGLPKHMKAELRPKQRPVFDAYTKLRVVVRNLIPRNPQLDKELIQTVCVLSKTPDQNTIESMVIYIPHADDVETIPYYHPKVHSLALLHTFNPVSHTGSLSVHYQMPSVDIMSNKSHIRDEEFLARPTLPQRLERTALNLLRIIHKHAHGQQAGYKKRVQHDVLIDQVSFQNRYTKLKQKYAKSLLETWVEVTDPQKHVFEDLGIAAFLIEIWKGMYGSSKKRSSFRDRGAIESGTDREADAFPGFVDIGCGNGVLVHILISEGYQGWGFDVRRRKSWSVFPEAVQNKLEELVLVPKVLQSALAGGEGLDFLKTAGIHDGVFPAGTFIISNHADQLTPWTPLLAYLSNSPFISIPCCSHALSGKLWRFYDAMPAQAASSGQSISSETSQTSTPRDKSIVMPVDLPQESIASAEPEQASRPVVADGPGPASGSLARPAGRNGKPAMPSAYAGFTAYVMRIAAALDYKVESEVLRIPSTRNLSIIARRGPCLEDPSLDSEVRTGRVLQLLQQEIGDVSLAAREWVEGAIALKRKAGGGH